MPKHVESERITQLPNVISPMLKASLEFILPAVADGMSFSATGITLAVIRRQLKDLHKKVDLLLGSVVETAKDKFEEAMVSLENDNFR